MLGCHRGTQPAPPAPPPLTWQPTDVGPGHPAEEDAVQVGDLQPEGRDGGGWGEQGPVQPRGGPPRVAPHLLVLLHGPLRALAAVEEIPEGKGRQGRPGRGAPAPAPQRGVPAASHSPVELGEDVDGGARVAAPGRHHLHVDGVGPRQARARAPPPLAGPHVPRHVLGPPRRPRRRGALGHGPARHQPPRKAENRRQRPRSGPHPRASPRPPRRQ